MSAVVTVLDLQAVRAGAGGGDGEQAPGRAGAERAAGGVARAGAQRGGVLPVIKLFFNVETVIPEFTFPSQHISHGAPRDRCRR